MKLYTLYILKCPITFAIKYIGITTNLRERYQMHVCKTHWNEHPEKGAWIKSLLDLGLMPIVDVWERDLDVSKAEELEKYYISKFTNLLNRQGGGLIPPTFNRPHTEESKRKSFESNPRKKTVIQKTKSGEFVNEFPGVREAFRITGIDHRSISQVAAGSEVRKSAGGFKWEYK